MKLKDVDCLLEELSQEFNVPIPDYQVWEAKLIKKLKPLKPIVPDHRGYITIRFSRPFSFGALLQYSGMFACITFLVDKRHMLRKECVVHEFFHYKHYVEQGYKFDNLEAEEKLTKKETRRYLKKK